MPRHTILLACLISLAAAHSTAQLSNYPGPLQQPRDAIPLKLSGVVVNSVTGEPVPRALVNVFLGSQRATLTGSDGKFQFEGLVAGRTVVVAQKPGYFSEQEIGRTYNPQNFLNVTADTSEVIVKLVPESVIYGQVRDDDNEPLPHALVRASVSRILDGRRYWVQIGQANTNAAGEYRIAKLTPGRYLIALSTSQRNGSSGHGGFASIYYPSPPESNTSSGLEISAGQKLPQDFSLRGEPVFKISGVISAPPVFHMSNVGVLDRFRQSVPVMVQINGDTGKFEVSSLPAGSYVLEARGADQAQHQFGGELVFGVSAAVSGLHLYLTPAPSLDVQVRADFLNPQPAVTAPMARGQGSVMKKNMGPAGILPGGSPMVSVHLRSTGPVQQDSWSNFEGPPGRVTVSVKNIAAGRYTVDVLPQASQVYVQSAVCGGVNLLNDPLVVEAGRQLPTLEVVLRDDGGSVHGRVEGSGQLFSGAVIAVPASAPMQSPRTTYLGPDGSFDFLNLAPGDYQVFAFDHLERVEYSDREVLRNYAAKAASVTVSPGSNASITVQPALVGEP